MDTQASIKYAEDCIRSWRQQQTRERDLVNLYRGKITSNNVRVTRPDSKFSMDAMDPDMEPELIEIVTDPKTGKRSINADSGSLLLRGLEDASRSLLSLIETEAKELSHYVELLESQRKIAGRHVGLDIPDIDSDPKNPTIIRQRYDALSAEYKSLATYISQRNPYNKLPDTLPYRVTMTDGYEPKGFFSRWSEPKRIPYPKPREGRKIKYVPEIKGWLDTELAKQLQNRDGSPLGK